MDKILDAAGGLVTAASHDPLAITAFVLLLFTLIAYKSIPQDNPEPWKRYPPLVFIFCLAIFVIIRFVPPVTDKKADGESPTAGPAPTLTASDDPPRLTDLQIARFLAGMDDEARRNEMCLMLASNTRCSTILEAVSGLKVSLTQNQRKHLDEAIGQKNTAQIQRIVDTPSDSSLRSDRLLALGDSKGWDIDVFWCSGAPDDQARYNQATSVGNLLASLVGNRNALGTGNSVGRVRIRQLVAEKQGKNGNPSSGLVIVANDTEAELSVAARLATLVNDSRQLSFKVDKQPASPQQDYYLSTFVCR